MLFCFMCLFFAINMASKYECQKTETEIQSNKVKELEGKIRELAIINQELLHIRTVLAQEKEQLTKEIRSLQKKYPELEDWKLTSKNAPPTPHIDSTLPIQESKEIHKSINP